MFHWVRCLIRELYRGWRYYQHDVYVPLQREYFDRNDSGFDRSL